ncbi:hypothetical protein IEQ34_017538 [Dendrobium chrysotoxum]|uniref:Thaumatin-like protein n=1 Tax=Dendrobium chrysotoxum TaxID=161865 RepID=A0AAV7GBU6_DENCH|nr:hypothetical protein IEQ34_017538 [Dendrobium chrysotoxum]
MRLALDAEEVAESRLGRFWRPTALGMGPTRENFVWLLLMFYRNYRAAFSAVPSGSGIQLNSGQTWTIDVPVGTIGGHVWARTSCSFNASGNGNCETGNCGHKLSCTTYSSPPNTLAKFALSQFSNLDFFDISNVDRFNVGLDFSPATPNGRRQMEIF